MQNPPSLPLLSTQFSGIKVTIVQPPRPCHPSPGRLHLPKLTLRPQGRAPGLAVHILSLWVWFPHVGAGSPLCVRLHFVRATSSLCGDLCQDALPVSGRVSCSVRMDLSGFLLPLSQDRWLFPRLAVGSGAVGTRVCCCLSKSGCVSQAPSVWKTQGLSLVLKTLTPGVQTAFAGRPPSGASWVVVLRPCHRPAAGGGT